MSLTVSVQQVMPGDHIDLPRGVAQTQTESPQQGQLPFFNASNASNPSSRSTQTTPQVPLIPVNVDTDRFRTLDGIFNDEPIDAGGVKIGNGAVQVEPVHTAPTFFQNYNHANGMHGSRGHAKSPGRRPPSAQAVFQTVIGGGGGGGGGSGGSRGASSGRSSPLKHHTTVLDSFGTKFHARCCCSPSTCLCITTEGTGAHLAPAAHAPLAAPATLTKGSTNSLAAFAYWEKQARQASRDITTKQAEIESLRARVAQLQSEVDSTKRERDVSRSMIAIDQEVKLSGLEAWQRKKVQEATEKVANRDVEVDNLTRKVAEQDASRMKLKKELEDMAQDMVAQMNAQGNHRKAIDQKNDVIRELRNDLESLKSNLASKEKEREKFERRCEYLQEALANNTTSLTKTSSHQLDTLAALQTDHATLVAKHADTLAKITELRDFIAEQEAEMDRLRRYHPHSFAHGHRGRSRPTATMTTAATSSSSGSGSKGVAGVTDDISTVAAESLAWLELQVKELTSCLAGSISHPLTTRGRGRSIGHRKHQKHSAVRREQSHSNRPQKHHHRHHHRRHHHRHQRHHSKQPHDHDKSALLSKTDERDSPCRTHHNCNRDHQTTQTKNNHRSLSQKTRQHSREKHHHHHHHHSRSASLGHRKHPNDETTDLSTHLRAVTKLLAALKHRQKSLPVSAVTSPPRSPSASESEPVSESESESESASVSPSHSSSISSSLHRSPPHSRSQSPSQTSSPAQQSRPQSQSRSHKNKKDNIKRRVYKRTIHWVKRFREQLKAALSSTATSTTVPIPPTSKPTAPTSTTSSAGFLPFSALSVPSVSASILAPTSHDAPQLPSGNSLNVVIDSKADGGVTVPLKTQEPSPSTSNVLRVALGCLASLAVPLIKSSLLSCDSNSGSREDHKHYASRTRDDVTTNDDGNGASNSSHSQTAEMEQLLRTWEERYWELHRAYEADQDAAATWKQREASMMAQLDAYRRTQERTNQISPGQTGPNYFDAAQFIRRAATPMTMTTPGKIQYPSLWLASRQTPLSSLTASTSPASPASAGVKAQAGCSCCSIDCQCRRRL